MKANSHLVPPSPKRRCLPLQLTAAAVLTVLLVLNGSKEEKQEWMDLIGLQNKWIKDYEPPFETDFGIKDYDNVDEDVFTPLGYKMRERTIVPALDYVEHLNCSTVFQTFVRSHKIHNESEPPPKIIPYLLKGQYLLNGYVHLIKDYTDERSSFKEETWNKELLDRYLSRKGEKVDNYFHERRAIYFAMKSQGVKGMKGMVLGSRSPWVEAISLQLEASHITIVEYMKINIENIPQMSYIHPVKLAKEYRDHVGQYDFIVSFSSLEHSGLGRYGDALNPTGDLLESQKVLCLLKRGGFFFAGLPVGWDILHWNLHRVYGRVRLALFAAGFDIVEAFYRDQKVSLHVDWFQKPGDIEKNAKINFGAGSLWKQPVIVLKKR